MAKKLVLLTMTTAALAAVAVPSLASATQLTMPANTLVPSGTTFQAESTNVEMVTSFGTMKCEKVTLRLKVTANPGGSGAKVTASESGAATTSVCRLGSTGVNFTNIKIPSLESTSSTSGNLTFSFEADLPGVTCKFASKEGKTPATFTSGTDVLHVAGPLTASPSACGSATFKGDFTLATTEEKGPITIEN